MYCRVVLCCVVLNDVDLLTQYRGLLQRRVSAQLVAENLFLKLARA